MSTLFEIAAEYRADLAVLEDLDLDPQTLADTLDGMSGALESKALAVGAVVLNLHASADAIEAAAKAMAARAKAARAKAARLEEYLHAGLMVAGVQRVECPQYVIRVKSLPPQVEIEDVAQLPLDCLRIRPAPEPEPDKLLIAQRIKNGTPVPGARLMIGRTKIEVKS